MKKLSLFLVLAGFSMSLIAQVNCQIKVTQAGQTLEPVDRSSYKLKPDVFEIVVSPAICDPAIAIIPKREILTKLFEKPLIYVDGGAFMSGSNSERDIFLLVARTEFDPAYLELPSENSYQRKQYDAICDELKFCPTIYPIFSSAWPFVADFIGSKTTASFKRANHQLPISVLNGKRYAVVIYTLWRAIPSEYPMARPYPFLYQPHYLSLEFVSEK